jgi:hypothetical protein
LSEADFLFQQSSQSSPTIARAQPPRHQCMIYSGSPVKQLSGIAAVIIEKLKGNHRCLYLNSPPMVAGMRSYLAARGLDVHEQTKNGSLLLSSDQEHIVDGHFEAELIVDKLLAAMRQAQADGYAGLWASGDMTWELGNERNFVKLLDYECRLEETLRQNIGLSGICQYHVDTLPRHLVQAALHTHQAMFINETLTRMNPYYIAPDCVVRHHAEISPTELNQMLEHLLMAVPSKLPG